MQLHHGLITLLLALNCAERAAGRHAFDRQRDVTDGATSSGALSAPASSTGIVSSTQTAISDPSSFMIQGRSGNSSGTASLPSSTSGSSSSFISSVASTTFTASSATSVVSSSMSTLAAATSPSTTPAHSDSLPIQPEITPAIGIAGVILVVCGIALGLVGIKHKWLYIFLSTALLASLSVTVLIVYVMDAPVSNAVQGAYLIAAVVAGLIFGALALIFQEVADGLGCLLGGFCLAMWFLVLAPGGLIKSTSGRVALIAVFCILFFSLYFSHHTRNYGLIGCTAFAGAMVTILGIDCFSGAGLKEFWLYIWNLNEDEFPINTTTYPVTRGIRVEIACTIILFFFGVMSQLKIWQVIKKARAEGDAERRRWNESDDQFEEAVGHNVETRNERDRTQWEAVYGNRNDRNGSNANGESRAGSSYDSYPRKSASVTAQESDGFQVTHVLGASSKHPSKSDERPTVVVQAASGSSEESTPATAESQHHLTGGPDLSRKVSGRSNWFSRHNDSCEAFEQEGLTSIYVEDDGASSVAATMEDDPDGGAMSPPRLSEIASPYEFDFGEDGILAGSEAERDRSPDPWRSEPPIEEDDEEAVMRPESAQQDSNAEVVRSRSKRKGRNSISSSRRRSPASRHSGREEEVDDEDGNASLAGSLRDRLPQKMSRVAMTYRTNEWAKHSMDADEPDLSTMPGTEGDSGFPEEAVRPLDPHALMQGIPTERSETSRNPYQQHMKSHSRSSSAGAANPFHAVRHSSSQSSLRRQPRLATQNLRSASTPLASQPLVESPIEDVLASSGPYRNLASSNNLMDQRNRRLLYKPTSTPFNMLASTSNYNSVAPSESASVHGADDSDNISLANLKQQIRDDDDNMTLSERRVSLQQQRDQQRDESIHSRARPRQGTWPLPGGNANTNANNLPIIYDAHQPRRNRALDPIRQNNTLARWRQSLQADKLAKEPLRIDEHARQQLLTERRYAEWQQQRASYERSSREHVMDAAMRSGQLHEAHRDALRKMQAQATRKVTV